MLEHGHDILEKREGETVLVNPDNLLQFAIVPSTKINKARAQSGNSQFVVADEKKIAEMEAALEADEEKFLGLKTAALEVRAEKNAAVEAAETLDEFKAAFLALNGGAPKAAKG